MTVLFFILGAVTITVLALELRRRSKTNGDRAPKRRPAAARGGLVLERTAPAARKSVQRVSSLAGPIALGVIFIMLGAWMVFAYFVSGPETPAAAETIPVQPPALLASTLTGRLAGGDNGLESQALTTQAAAQADRLMAGQSQVVPDAGIIAAAARQAVLPDTRVGQTGLMPSIAAANERQANSAVRPVPAPAKPAATESASTAAQYSGNSNSAAKPEAAALNVRTVQPTPPPSAGSPGQPTMAAAASSGDPSAPRASVSVGPEAVLGGLKEFTVHLASFGEKSNAETYKSKLASAGESAFISEITVEGKLWYRVMSGRFSSRSEAEDHGRDLRRRDLTADTGRYLIKPLE